MWRERADVAAAGVDALVIPTVRRFGDLYSIDLKVMDTRRHKYIFTTKEEGRGLESIPHMVDAIEGRADALYVCGDPLQFTHRIRINTLALGLRLPTIVPRREEAEAAGLMSYGPDALHLARRAAEYVDKILRGAKPADLPVEQPTKFEFVVNLTTAKALRLDLPATLLARADEVIE